MLNQELELSTPGSFMIVADPTRCPMCGSINILPSLAVEDDTAMYVCQSCGHAWE